MGNESSRLKITQPLLDAASYLWQRTQIWNRFQVLVQRIKDAVGFGVSNLTARFPAMETDTML